jgi:hypothetical protein
MTDRPIGKKTGRSPTNSPQTTWSDLSARERLRVIIVLALMAGLVALPWVSNDSTRAFLKRAMGPVLMAGWCLWFGLVAARAFKSGRRWLGLLAAVGVALGLLMLLVFI